VTRDSGVSLVMHDTGVGGVTHDPGVICVMRDSRARLERVSACCAEERGGLDVA